MNNYFAKAPTDHIAQEVLSKFAEHERFMADSGLGYQTQTLYDTYYSIKDGGFEVSLSKDRSTAKISVNNFKNLIQRLHSITTQAKLAYTPRAKQSDAKSMIQADFARGLLEYYGDEKNMNAVVSEMVEKGLVMLDSYIYAPWDEHQGEVVATGEGLTELKNGDQGFFVLSRFDVASHPRLTKSPYYIIRLKVNKYDLAALYPDKADEILALSVSAKAFDYSRLTTPIDTVADLDEDLVEQYIFLHDRTPSMPKGRQTIIVGDMVLADSVLRYKTLPVVPFAPGKMLETIVGDSPATSLVSMQQVSDALWSGVTTNNLNYLKQSIWSPTAIDIRPLSKGMQLVVSPQPPQALQLTQSSPETYKLIDSLQNQGQILSGVNSTARGNPEASLKSGTSLALMLAVAVQFADGIQKAYAQAASQLATIVIHNLQTFASEPRIAYIGGISKKSYAKTFKADDLMLVDRVSCDLGNPLTNNIAGRQELVNNWMQYGVLKDPSKIIEFLRTGQIDSISEDTFRHQILIREENEMLRKGETPIVAMFDMHPQHIAEHAALSNDPVVRSQPEVMRALTEHLQEHLNLYKTIDPDLAAILQMPPLPSMANPPAPAPEGQPEMMGANLPQTPEGTPAELAQDYDAMLASMSQMPAPEEV